MKIELIRVKSRVIKYFVDYIKYNIFLWNIVLNYNYLYRICYLNEVVICWYFCVLKIVFWFILLNFLIIWSLVFDKFLVDKVNDDVIIMMDV